MEEQEVVVEQELQDQMVVQAPPSTAGAGGAGLANSITGSSVT
jgi:hypothetical protein